MRPSLKRNIIRNLASPYALAMFSFCVFLFAWVFPPDVYTDFIHEPNLMFLNLPTLGFYASCVAAFMLGLRSVRSAVSSSSSLAATSILSPCSPPARAR